MTPSPTRTLRCRRRSDTYRTTYTLGESAAGTDEETSTDGTTDGNHVKMALLHGPVELDDSETIVTLLEGREVEAISGHEVLIPDGGSCILRAVFTTVSGEDSGRLGDDAALLHVWGRRRVVVDRHDVEAQWGSIDL